jgi:hypothetical protein
VQPAGELAQLGVGERRLLAHALEQRGGPLGVVADAAQREAGEMAEGEQALLGAVVQVAPDAPALVVGGLHHARAGRRDLGLALAQGDLVTAAVDLGRRARGEDGQRGDLVVARVDAAAGEHADVAEVGAADAAHGEREVGLEVLAADDRPRGKVGADAVRDDDHVLFEHLLADRPGERVLGALGEPRGPAVPGGDDAHPPRAVIDRLGHERELGVERFGDVVDERAQERLADDPGRPRRDGPEEVALSGGGAGAGRRLEEGRQGQSRVRRTEGTAMVEALCAASGTANPRRCRRDTRNQWWSATIRRSPGRQPSGCWCTRAAHGAHCPRRDPSRAGSQSRGRSARASGGRDPGPRARRRAGSGRARARRRGAGRRS